MSDGPDDLAGMLRQLLANREEDKKVMAERFEQLEMTIDGVRKTFDDRFSNVESQAGASKTQMENLQKKVDDIVNQVADKGNKSDVGSTSGAVGADKDTLLEEQAGMNQERTPYDPRNMYLTLINPFARTPKELSEYVNSVAEEYSARNYEALEEQFHWDFKYWTLKHFEVVKGTGLSIIRDKLFAAGAGVSTSGPARISKKLFDFLEKLRESCTPTVSQVRDEIKQVVPKKVNVSADSRGRSDRHKVEDDEVQYVPLHLRNRAARDAIRADTRHTSYSGYRTNDELARVYGGRVSDVAKLFAREDRYSGGPQENLRSRYELFQDACMLAKVDVGDDEIIMRLMGSIFVVGQARVFFRDKIRGQGYSPAQAIDALESQFLGKRARRVNNEVWDELSFNSVKSKRAFSNLSTSNADVLADLLTQIAELCDMRTGSRSEDEIVAKTLASVRKVPAFAGICSNPPDEQEALHAALRSRALEMDRNEIDKQASPLAYHQDPGDGYASDEEAGAIEAATEAVHAYYTDRRLRYPQDDSRRRPSIRGYGRGQQNSRGRFAGPRGRFGGRRSERIPRDVCIVCFKKGCHSSKHPEAMNAARVLFHASLGDDSGKDVDEEEQVGVDEQDEGYAAFCAYASSTRATIAMGVPPKSAPMIVDAAMIDTGSSVLSSIGNDHTTALRVASVRPVKLQHSSRKIRGIGGILTESLGTILFSFYFGAELYEVQVYVVPGDSPLIFSHLDIDRMDFNYQTKYKTITRTSDGYTEEVEMRGNLPFLVFSAPGHFTEDQLRTMHRNLGHPALEKQMRVIESADITDLSSKTRQVLKHIVDNCRVCQLARAKPRRFLFSMKDDVTGEFNHVLQVDVVHLSDGNVLHVICTGTGFQQGIFINQMSAESAWMSLKRCWINVFAGAPDYLVTDAGSNFTAKEIKDAASSMGIIVKTVPTEAHNRVGKIERSHAALRSVYDKLKADLPSIRREDRLSMAFRAINDAPASGSGISPTMLVFGVLPKIPGAGFRGSYAQRANVVRECTKLVIQMNARRTLRDSIRERNIPALGEQSKVRNTVPGSKVLVYREKGGWKPYTLVRVRENEVDVILPSGLISTFALSVVRPFLAETSESPTASEKKAVTPKNSQKPVRDPYLLRSRTRAGHMASIQHQAVAYAVTDAGTYRQSRLDEMNGLRELGCFEVVDRTESEGHRLYRAVFVDKVKADGEKKSRLCVAACNDQEHGLLTGAPTVKRLSMRMLTTLATCFGLTMFTRDVTKAFIQSATTLQRSVYMQAPSEMNLPRAKVLKVLKPLYGMPESPMHWYSTYLEHHKSRMEMEQVPLDPCLMFKRDSNTLAGLLGLQVDDTLYAGNASFLDAELKNASTFPSKGRTIIASDKVRFNGIEFSTSAGNVVMDQRFYIEDIPPLPTKSATTFEDFRSIRAKLAYAAFSTCPDALVFIANLAQFTEERFLAEKDEAIRVLRKADKTLRMSPSIDGMKFVPLVAENIEVVACIDAAFAVNKDSSSQLGILVMLRDSGTGRVNIVHYSSTKSKRVCKSVLGAELFALVDGFDMAAAIKDTIERISARKNIPLILYTDSQSLYGLCISLSPTTEKRLQIDLALIRQAYEAREITKIVWISGDGNPADDLTKVDKRNRTLARLIATNKFDPPAQAWVDRNQEPPKNKNANFESVGKSVAFAKQKVAGVSHSPSTSSSVGADKVVHNA